MKNLLNEKEFTIKLNWETTSESEEAEQILSRFDNGDMYRVKSFSPGGYVKDEDGDTSFHSGEIVFERKPDRS